MFWYVILVLFSPLSLMFGLVSRSGQARLSASGARRANLTSRRQSERGDPRVWEEPSAMSGDGTQASDAKCLFVMPKGSDWAAITVRILGRTGEGQTWPPGSGNALYAPVSRRGCASATWCDSHGCAPRDGTRVPGPMPCLDADTAHMSVSVRANLQQEYRRHRGSVVGDGPGHPTTPASLGWEWMSGVASRMRPSELPPVSLNQRGLEAG